MKRSPRPFRRKRNKFGAVPTRGYASKLEARYADHLAELKKAGEILDWLEQVPIKLPGGTKFVCDFAVINNDGTVRFVEVKGKATDVFKLKMRLLDETRPAIFSRLEVVE